MAREDGQNSFAPAAAEPAGEARETSCASRRTKSLVARPRKGRLNELELAATLSAARVVRTWLQRNLLLRVCE